MNDFRSHRSKSPINDKLIYLQPVFVNVVIPQHAYIVHSEQSSNAEELNFFEHFWSAGMF